MNILSALPEVANSRPNFAWFDPLKPRRNRIAQFGAALFFIFVVSLKAGNPSAVLPTQVLSSGTNGFQEFGVSVAVDGNTLVVGAPFTSQHLTGAAYVFVRQAGQWLLEHQLLPPVPLPTFGYFGESVAVSGDTIVIGVASDDVSQTHVYVRGKNGWTLQQTLNARSRAVAIDGNTLLAADESASFIDGPIDLGEAGVVQVFVRSNSTWTLQQRLNAGDPHPTDYFGTAVSLHGDTAVIGAIGDLSTSDESGAAYVFQRTGTNWVQTQKLKASDAQRAADFGRALALKQNALVVGAPGYVDVYMNSGAAYVFTRTKGVWIEQQKLSPSDPAAHDGFGVSVALTDHQIVIGQLDGKYADATLIPFGAAYIFKNAGSWMEQGKLSPKAGTRGEWFGLAVASSGDTIVVGAPSILGSAYIYERLVLSHIRRTVSGATLSFGADTLRSYTVECSDSLSAPTGWRTITNIIGAGELLSLPLDTTASERFYRVILDP